MTPSALLTVGRRNDERVRDQEGDEHGERADGTPSTRGSGSGELAPGMIAAVVVLLLVIGALAGLYSASGPSTYAAQADLLYVDDEASQSQNPERELATQQVLLMNRGQVESAASAVGLRPRQLTERTSVELVEDSSVLRYAGRGHRAGACASRR
jgi:hypothetical protein